MTLNTLPDLSDFTFVITFRGDCAERIENLAYCLSDYMTTGTRFIVVESDTESCLTPLQFPFTGDGAVASHIFIPSNDSSFHKTRLFNTGLAEVKTEFFGHLDCDVLCNADEVRKAGQWIRDKITDFAYPYGGAFLEISRKTLAFILKKEHAESMEVRLLHPHSVGGLIMGRTDLFRLAGGENENFRSWGSEDRERHIRLVKLGYRVMRTEGVILHMEHPRGLNSSDKNPFFEANEAEFVRLSQLDRAGLAEEIKAWKWAR